MYEIITLDERNGLDIVLPGMDPLRPAEMLDLFDIAVSGIPGEYLTNHALLRDVSPEWNFIHRVLDSIDIEEVGSLHFRILGDDVRFEMASCLLTEGNALLDDHGIDCYRDCIHSALEELDYNDTCGLLIYALMWLHATNNWREEWNKFNWWYSWQLLGFSLPLVRSFICAEDFPGSHCVFLTEGCVPNVILEALLRTRGSTAIPGYYWSSFGNWVAVRDLYPYLRRREIHSSTAVDMRAASCRWLVTAIMHYRETSNVLEPYYA